MIYSKLKLDVAMIVLASVLPIIGSTDGCGTVASVLTSDVVEPTFQCPVLAKVLVNPYLCIEIGWGVCQGIFMTAGAP